MLTVGYVTPSAWEFCQPQDSYGFAPGHFRALPVPFYSTLRGYALSRSGVPPEMKKPLSEDLGFDRPASG